jgi:hypothetical protein
MSQYDGFSIDFGTRPEPQRETDQQRFERLFARFLDSTINDGTPPASHMAIEELDTIVFDERDLRKYGAEQCPVCTNGFKLDEEAKKLPCKHVFHTDCILPWLGRHNTCPMCRHELPTADIEYEAEKRARSRAQRTNNNQTNNAPRANNGNNAAPTDPVARMFANMGINVRYDDEDDDEDGESNPSAISSMYS